MSIRFISYLAFDRETRAMLKVPKRSFDVVVVVVLGVESSSKNFPWEQNMFL